MDKKLEERLERIENLLRNLSSNPRNPEIPVLKVCTREVTFTFTLQPLQGVEMEEPCPLTGEITEVTMHFPDGCAGLGPTGYTQLVQLAFGHSGVSMFPSKRGEYIALNDATPTWRNLREPVLKGERLWAELRNGDSANPHKPSILVTISGVE